MNPVRRLKNPVIYMSRPTTREVWQLLYGAEPDLTGDLDGLGGYRITTRAYDYSVQTQDRQLVVAFHWHPTGNSDVTTPHLHIGAQQLSAEAVISHKDHIGTGRIIRRPTSRLVFDACHCHEHRLVGLTRDRQYRT
jgi:hypothetical protein